MHARAHGLLSLWNVELDQIRDVNGSGKDDPRTLIGNLTNETFRRPAAIVKIDTAGQEAFLPYGPAAFDHLRLLPSALHETDCANED